MTSSFLKGDFSMNQRLINYFAFAILGLLWLGFGAALLFNPEILQAAWQAFRGWSWVVQALVSLLTLPVVLGLWVWQTTWPLWLRLILVIGLAWVTLYTFFPKKADNQPEMVAVKSY
jgi:putative copper export protein